jgi:hypothetical protein
MLSSNSDPYQSYANQINHRQYKTFNLKQKNLLPKTDQETSKFPINPTILACCTQTFFSPPLSSCSVSTELYCGSHLSSDCTQFSLPPLSKSCLFEAKMLFSVNGLMPEILDARSFQCALSSSLIRISHGFMD